MMPWSELAAVTVLMGGAVVGGMFFAFSTVVMRSLSQVKAEAAIAVMQSINRVVINPWFLGLFIGTAALSLVLTVLTLLRDEGNIWFLSGALCYLIGTFGVTVLANVPLNNRLANLPADDRSSEPFWRYYLSNWTRWNHIRTVAAIMGSLLILAGLLISN